MHKEGTVQEKATAQVQLTRHITASCLIEALSADPVNPALKQTLKKSQQAPKASADKATKGRGSGRGKARRG
jgi:hypothetical protein